MDVSDHKVVRDLDRVFPLAAHRTLKGNLRFDIRVRFIQPDSGNLCAEFEFYDPQGNSLNKASNGTSLPLSNGDNDPIDTVKWYFGLLAEMAYNDINERKTNPPKSPEVNS